VKPISAKVEGGRKTNKMEERKTEFRESSVTSEYWRKTRMQSKTQPGRAKRLGDNSVGKKGEKAESSKEGKG